MTPYLRSLSHRSLHLACAVFILAASGCQQEQSPPAQTGGAAPPPTKVDMVTITASTVTLNETSAARVTAYRTAEVRPQVNGIILKRLFEEGSTVKEGALLYQVDPAIYQASLDSAKAQLAVAQANVSSTRNKAERYRDLARQNAVSQQESDDAQSAWKQAQAQIQAAKAAVQQAQIDLDYTKITAPISGVISRSAVTEGALVSARQATALATIRQLQPVYVDIKRTAADAMKTRQLGQSVDLPVTIAMEDGTPFSERGKLQFSEASVDETTGMVNARAVFENKDGLLLPGMFVHATLATENVENAILAPQQGVTRTANGGTVAMVIGADNKVESRPVSVSRTVGDQWLVTSGLSAGDRVIITGLQKIKPGATVEPIEKSAHAQ